MKLFTPLQDITNVLSSSAATSEKKENHLKRKCGLENYENDENDPGSQNKKIKLTEKPNTNTLKQLAPKKKKRQPQKFADKAYHPKRDKKTKHSLDYNHTNPFGFADESETVMDPLTAKEKPIIAACAIDLDKLPKNVDPVLFQTYLNIHLTSAQHTSIKELIVNKKGSITGAIAANGEELSIEAKFGLFIVFSNRQLKKQPKIKKYFSAEEIEDTHQYIQPGSSNGIKQHQIDFSKKDLLRIKKEEELLPQRNQNAVMVNDNVSASFGSATNYVNQFDIFEIPYESKHDFINNILAIGDTDGEHNWSHAIPYKVAGKLTQHVSNLSAWNKNSNAVYLYFENMTSLFLKHFKLVSWETTIHMIPDTQIGRKLKSGFILKNDDGDTLTIYIKHNLQMINRPHVLIRIFIEHILKGLIQARK